MLQCTVTISIIVIVIITIVVLLLLFGINFGDCCTVGGGLLATIPEAATANCIQQLHEAGYPAACLIGHVTQGPGRVRLL